MSLHERLTEYRVEAPDHKDSDAYSSQVEEGVLQPIICKFGGQEIIFDQYDLFNYPGTETPASVIFARIENRLLGADREAGLALIALGVSLVPAEIAPEDGEKYQLITDAEKIHLEKIARKVVERARRELEEISGMKR